MPASEVLLGEGRTEPGLDQTIGRTRVLDVQALANLTTLSLVESATKNVTTRPSNCRTYLSLLRLYGSRSRSRSSTRSHLLQTMHAQRCEKINHQYRSSSSAMLSLSSPSSNSSK